MSFCIKCGAQITPGYKFCTFCGAPAYQAPQPPQQQNGVPGNGYYQQPSAPAYPVFRQTPPPEINIPLRQTPQQPSFNAPLLQVPIQQMPPEQPMYNQLPSQAEQHQHVGTQVSTLKPGNNISESLNEKVNSLVRESLQTNGYLLKDQPLEPDGLEFRRDNRSFIYDMTRGSSSVLKHFTIITAIATFEEKDLLDKADLISTIISTINAQEFASKLYFGTDAISRKKHIYYVMAQYSLPKHLITEENVTSLIEEITDELNLQVMTFLEAAKNNGISKLNIVD